jgi:hypothetical protein
VLHVTLEGPGTTLEIVGKLRSASDIPGYGYAIPAGWRFYILITLEGSRCTNSGKLQKVTA